MFLLFILKFPYGHVYRESLLFIIAYRQLLFGFPIISSPAKALNYDFIHSSLKITRRREGREGVSLGGVSWRLRCYLVLGGGLG